MADLIAVFLLPDLAPIDKHLIRSVLENSFNIGTHFQFCDDDFGPFRSSILFDPSMKYDTLNGPRLKVKLFDRWHAAGACGICALEEKHAIEAALMNIAMSEYSTRDTEYLEFMLASLSEYLCRFDLNVIEVLLKFRRYGNITVPT